MTLVRRRLASLLLLLWLLSCLPVEKEACSTELPAAAEGTFSLVVLPDTQHYQGRGTKSEPGGQTPVTNPSFDAWTDWIVANLDRQRIVFVSHVGDIVDKNEREQWSVARRCMDKLHGKVPYAISVGNHDMSSGAGDSSLFQEFFPSSRFEGFGWYGGCFVNPNAGPAISGNNANSFQLFEAAGLSFVALHLECNAPDNVLAWADSVLEEHAERRALVVTHMGLGPLEKPRSPRDYFDAPKGRMTWSKCHGKRGNTPQQMWNKCFRRHGNLFLICCGDQSRTQALRQTSRGDQGNPVHELLSDYGVNGFRVMQFIPAQDRIDVRTWNSINHELCSGTELVADRDAHQFTLPYVMSRNERRPAD